MFRSRTQAVSMLRRLWESGLMWYFRQPNARFIKPIPHSALCRLLGITCFMTVLSRSSAALYGISWFSFNLRARTIFPSSPKKHKFTVCKYYKTRRGQKCSFGLIRPERCARIFSFQLSGQFKPTWIISPLKLKLKTNKLVISTQQIYPS